MILPSLFHHCWTWWIFIILSITIFSRCHRCHLWCHPCYHHRCHHQCCCCWQLSVIPAVVVIVVAILVILLIVVVLSSLLVGHWPLFLSLSFLPLSFSLWLSSAGWLLPCSEHVPLLLVVILLFWCHYCLQLLVTPTLMLTPLRQNRNWLIVYFIHVISSLMLLLSAALWELCSKSGTLYVQQVQLSSSSSSPSLLCGFSRAPFVFSCSVFAVGFSMVKTADERVE